jgi:hypothetical protein
MLSIVSKKSSKLQPTKWEGEEVIQALITQRKGLALATC